MTIAEPTLRVLLAVIQVTDLSLVPGARLGTPVDAADTAGQVILNHSCYISCRALQCSILRLHPALVIDASWLLLPQICTVQSRVWPEAVRNPYVTTLCWENITLSDCWHCSIL